MTGPAAAPPDPDAPVSILHLDDSPDDATLVKAHLRRDKLDCDIRWVQTKDEFVRALSTARVDLILSDYRMPGWNGDQALEFVRTHHPQIPFIMVTGELGEDRAIETLKRGATDYVLKGNLARLAPAVDRALRDARAAAERRAAEAELASLRESLARELADMRRLHELSIRLLHPDTLESLLGQVLSACLELLGAAKGNVQILDGANHALKIVTQVGFDEEFVKQFRSVPVGRDCMCSKALESRARVIVEDVFAEKGFQEVRPVFARLGLRGCTSTPLFCRDGKVFGMLSSHFERPHRPSERDLQLLDLYIQQAERVIEFRQGESVC